MPLLCLSSWQASEKRQLLCEDKRDVVNASVWLQRHLLESYSSSEVEPYSFENFILVSEKKPHPANIKHKGSAVKVSTSLFRLARCICMGLAELHRMCKIVEL